MAQTTLDTDSFNGTNTATLPSYNANWISGGGFNSCVIAGTPGVGSQGFSRNHRTGQTWTNDQFAQMTVDATTLASHQWFVGVRNDVTAGTGYFGGIDPNSINTVYRINHATAGTLIAEPGNTSMATGDIVNLQIIGTVLTLTVTRAGSNAFTPLTYDTASDGTKYSTGNPGLILTHTSSTVRLAGSWVAGSASAGGGGTTLNTQTGAGLLTGTTATRIYGIVVQPDMA